MSQAQRTSKCFTDQEMTALLRAAKRRSARGTIVDKADYAMLIFAYASGCRVSEIASTTLNRSDPNHFDVDGAVLRIGQAKYESVGVVPIDVDSLRILKWYIRDVRPQFRNAAHLPHLFLSKVGRPYRPNVLTQKFSLMLARLGYPGYTCHAFRHYFVTDLLKRSCHTHVVQKLARHKDARTTLQTYAHADEADMREAVNRRLG